MPSDLRQQVREEVARLARGGELAALLGPANANALAQQGGGGLGIQNVRRGVLFAKITGTPASIAVSNTTFAPLSTPLKGTIFLSGRPLFVIASAVAGGGSGSTLLFDMNLRDASMSGVNFGIAYTPAATILSRTPWAFTPAPAPGSAEIELVAKVDAGTSTIYTDVHLLTLLALEL